MTLKKVENICSQCRKSIVLGHMFVVYIDDHNAVYIVHKHCEREFLA